MKTSQLKTNNPIRFFRKHKRITSILSYILLIAFLNLATGCSYYNVKQVPNTKETIVQNVNQFNDVYRYVIVHRSGSSWHLSNVKLDDVDMSISGTIQPLNYLHINSQNRDTKSTHRYKPKKQSPLDEVHFYLDNEIALYEGKDVIIPFENIKSISVNEHNKSKSAGMTTLTVVGVTLGTLALLTILVALLKSSCPFVYIDDGDEFAFVGELYPGAIFPNLQRDDYIPLPGISAKNNKSTIKITNELLEIQYTDLAQMIVVDHSENIEVLLDKDGKLHTISNLISPTYVTLDDKSKFLEPSLRKDNHYYAFNSEIKNKNSTRSIQFEFDRPSNATKGKLYLTAKNSLWLDYVYGKFNEQFGSYYSKHQKDQENTSKEQKMNWLNNQNIPLSVYLKTSNDWKLVNRVNTVGPLAMRDLVIPIDMEEAIGDHIQIKLETGFMFWEVDYVGMDYSENIPLDIHYLEPTLALDENNNEVTNLLKKTDQHYLVQPKVGNEVVVTFSSDVIDETKNQSFFLKNRGYYTYIRDYTGIPDFDYLKSFKETGAFTRFSEEVYHIVIDVITNEEISMTHE